MRRLLLFLAALPGLFVPTRARADEPARFEWEDGDRVVLIGDALIERDQKYGFLETFITVLNPDKTITFRNLGWSGDTPQGIARAGFGKPEEGYRHLVEHVRALKPTVIVIGYGMTDSFDGEAGLPRFKDGMNRLLDAIAETEARLLFLSPIAHEDLGRPLIDPTRHNQDLRLYRDAIREIAKEHEAPFIDLFEHYELWSSLRRHEPVEKYLSFSDDGIHLDEGGYWSSSVFLHRSLGDPRVEGVNVGPDGELRGVRGARIDFGGTIRESRNTSIEKVTASPRGLRFELTSRFLSPPASSRGKLGTAPLVLVFDDLPDGRYVLSVDGRPVEKGNAEDWRMGVPCAGGPEDDQVEQLRQAIIEKDRLYFYRWRPQNETYLFGFRKHEQGNNAREIPLFDPLVEEKEKEIARLRVPVMHVYELVRQGEVKK